MPRLHKELPEHAKKWLARSHNIITTPGGELVPPKEGKFTGYFDDLGLVGVSRVEKKGKDVEVTFHDCPTPFHTEIRRFRITPEGVATPVEIPEAELADLKKIGFDQLKKVIVEE